MPSHSARHIPTPAEASEALIRPSTDIGFFGWLVLLGLPLLLLFLIYGKMQAGSSDVMPASPSAVIETQRAAHP
jgi:hypothetical protein